MFSDLNYNPAPDFSKPLELLKACHEKIRFHCNLLVRLCHYLENHAVDQDAIKTAEQVLRYFSSSAVFHHLDEDDDLYPILLDKPTIKAVTKELIQQLQQEHDLLERQWLKFEGILKNQSLNQLPGMLDEALLLKTTYEQHIENENQQILPEAEKLLTKHEQTSLGQAMQKRRQQAVI